MEERKENVLQKRMQGKVLSCRYTLSACLSRIASLESVRISHRFLKKHIMFLTKIALTRFLLGSYKVIYDLGSWIWVRKEFPLMLVDVQDMMHRWKEYIVEIWQKTYNISKLALKEDRQWIYFAEEKSWATTRKVSVLIECNRAIQKRESIAGVDLLLSCFLSLGSC